MQAKLHRQRKPRDRQKMPHGRLRLAGAAPEKLRQEDGSPYPFRRLRTREGVKIFSGYSDHFPIVVTVSERESEE